MRMCHLYVSSEVGPEWPPLAPGDCGKVARFSLYPLICAHLRSDEWQLSSVHGDLGDIPQALEKTGG